MTEHMTMKKHIFQKVLISTSMVGLLWLTGTRLSYAQFTQNRETVNIDSASYPADIRKDYGKFVVKCGECHTLDRSLKPTLPSAQWASVVKRMQAMASSHITDHDVQDTLNFLNYDEEHRKAQLKPVVAAAVTASIAAGPQLFASLGCNTCHSIAGKGGDVGPALNGIGTKLSPDQITQIVKNGKPNTAMPGVPAGTSDEQVKQLVDYLASLK
jgi:mono/diheme cytochrome c family protein